MQKFLGLITQLSEEMQIIYLCQKLQFVGPCHHVTACPHVADEATASDVEGSCE